MMNKTVIGLAVLVFVAAAAVFVWKTLPSASKPAPVQESVVPQQMATSTYATSTFSVVYPNDFAANGSYMYDKVNPKKPIYGVKFSVPVAMATGTNLSATDTGVSVEQLPRAKTCSGDIYLAANVKPIKITENGIEYSVATSSDAGADNFYEEIVYAFAGSSPCTAVRYFIHSMNIGNFPTSTVTEFDRTALISAFDGIRRAVTLGSSPASVPAPASTTP